MKKSSFFAGLFLLTSVSAFAENASTIVFSQTLRSEEKDLVQKSLDTIQEKKIDSKKALPAFKKFFGQDTLSALTPYLNQRVQLIVSPRTRLWVKTDAPQIPMLPIMISESSPNTNNPSLMLWIANGWNHNAAPDNLEGFDLKKSSMPKFVQLGTDFGRYNPLFGLSILVHEARHSDCEKGLSAEKLAQWKNKSLKELSVAIGDDSCGYSHQTCTTGPNAGKAVCDSSLKGAYAYQYVFNRTMVKACENCSFPEKLIMQIFALDAASKMPLPSELQNSVTSLLNELPELQKKDSPSIIVEQILERALQPIDDLIAP